jgi:hypothetical protein
MKRRDKAISYTAFARSIAAPQPPAGLAPAVEALWWDAKGDWKRAHRLAQMQDDGDGAWVHAYLHRKEGDQSNARYWYRKAGKAPATIPLAEEWRAIARALLARGQARPPSVL